jgi:5'-nucleotidase
MKTDKQRRIMHILLTNDDGVFAPGLAAIHKQLVQMGKVTVVAPSEAKSGASHSISLAPLSFQELDKSSGFTGYSVDGTPADCVKLAVMELVKEPIDLVVSGINRGANVGIDVCYSGTVAAAVEAAFYNIASIALSTISEENIDFEMVADYCFRVIEKLLPLAKRDVVNVNIPRLSKGPPKGVKITAQGVNGYDENYTVTTDRQNRIFYKLNYGAHREKTSGNIDVTSLLNGFITVTALHFDMTDYKKNKRLRKINLK